MPRNIAEYHDEILLNYANTNQRFCGVTNQIDTVIVTKEKSALSVSIMIKLISDISGIIEFVGLIKPNHSEEKNLEFAVLDDHGMLTCCTNGLKDILRINNEIIEKYGFNFFLLTPDLLSDILEKKPGVAVCDSESSDNEAQVPFKKQNSLRRGSKENLARGEGRRSS